MSLNWQPSIDQTWDLFAEFAVRPDADMVRLFTLTYDREGGLWSIGLGVRELHRGPLSECVAVAENKECKLLEAWKVIED